MSDADGGVEESVHSSARIALTVAIQLGEKLSRAYQDAMWEAQQRSAAHTRELTARHDSERTTARQAVSVVHDPRWWENASVQDVARAAETAAAWKSADPDIAHADAVIAVEARERYGVDIATLRAVARDTPTEVDLAKQWATTAAPEDYHRHDDARLTIPVGAGVEGNVAAERALVADYRAAVAGDIPALELSVAEEWKRANDPIGYQDYRIETSVAFDDNGRATPVDPAVADAARAALVQEWRIDQAGSPDIIAAAAERAQSRRDVTEAQVMIAEADRLDRANDVSGTDPGLDDAADGTRRADELEQQAARYDTDTDGTPDRDAQELRALAEDARAQAGAGGVQAAAARAEGEIAYDSAERRACTAATMRAKGVPEDQVAARMTVDASFAKPAQELSTTARNSVPRTRNGSGRALVVERTGQVR